MRPPDSQFSFRSATCQLLLLRAGHEFSVIFCDNAVKGAVHESFRPGASAREKELRRRTCCDTRCSALAKVAHAGITEERRRLKRIHCFRVDCAGSCCSECAGARAARKICESGEAYCRSSQMLPITATAPTLTKNIDRPCSPALKTTWSFRKVRGCSRRAMS